MNYRQVKDKVIQFSVKWTILLNITLIMYRQVKDKVIQFSVKWTILLNNINNVQTSKG